MTEQIDSPIESNTIITSDERLLAALAHGSVILSFMGPIIPGLIWVSQRRKSTYAAFHALQAMGYQMLTFWVGMTAYLLFTILFSVLAIPIMALVGKGSSDPMTTSPFLVQGIFFLFIFGFMGLYFLFGIAGAVLCGMGKDFNYPFLGKRLNAYLGRGNESTAALDETKADQWMAGMCHASAILVMWGVILPLLVWVTQKERSLRLRFQSMQAMVYQLIGLVGYFGFMAIYFVSFFGLMGSLIFLPSISGDTNTSLMIVLFVFLGIMLLLGLVFAIILPTYHLFAMIAGIQVVRGKDYYYPLLGKFLARRFGNSWIDS